MESSKQNSNSKESLITFSPEETPTPVSAHHPDITMATRQTKASLKYKEIIFKSSLIQSGSPAIYQLKPKKEKIKTLTRFTVGEKDPNKKTRTILLVGETGAGKSALVNALVNYAMGVKWEDDVWFQIVEEEEKKRQSESQTPDVIVYQIFGFEGKTLPYSLTIIDTPGYGDTRGIEQDDVVSERLLDWFCSDDGVHEINAVGLVLKATENQLTDRMRYIFDSVMSLFGKNMEESIVALLTHSNGLTPENALKALEDANIKCAKDEDNEPLHFMFDNCQSKEKTEKTKVALKRVWDITTEGLSQFTDFLVSAAPQKLMMTVQVLTERKILKACIQNLKDKIEFTEVQQREIEQTEEALKKHEQKMEKNENFIQEVDEPYKEREDIKGGYGFLWIDYKAATSCNICEETCHYPCTKSWFPKNCSVMENGHCTICTRKCPASEHVKEKWRYVIKTRKVTKTMDDLKEKYEKNKEGHKNKLSLLQSVRMKMEELQRKKDKVLEESFGHVVKLEQIALNVDSLSTLVHLDFLIERMKERGDTEKIQILEEMKSRMDDKARAAAQYKQAACGKDAEK